MFNQSASPILFSYSCFSYLVKTPKSGQRDRSAGKGTCHEAWLPEFEFGLRNPHGGRSENWLLQVALWPAHVCCAPPPPKHTQIITNKLKIKESKWNHNRIMLANCGFARSFVYLFIVLLCAVHMCVHVCMCGCVCICVYICVKAWDWIQIPFYLLSILFPGAGVFRWTWSCQFN